MVGQSKPNTVNGGCPSLASAQSLDEPWGSASSNNTFYYPRQGHEMMDS